MKSIKLTLTDGRDFFVFVDKITDIIRKEKSEGSFVTLVGNDGSSVIETPEQILEQIENIRPKLKSMNEGIDGVFDVCSDGFGLRFDFAGFQNNSFEIYDTWNQKTVKKLTCFETPKDCVSSCVEVLKNL